jgi:ferredoxin
MVKIKVNKELCIGCGACESICPETFGLKDGKAYAKKSEVKKITCEKEASDSCPVSAINIK